MATPIYNAQSTPESNLINLLADQNADGQTAASLNGEQPFEVLAAKAIYNVEQKASSAGPMQLVDGTQNVLFCDFLRDVMPGEWVRSDTVGFGGSVAFQAGGENGAHGIFLLRTGTQATGVAAIMGGQQFAYNTFPQLTRGAALTSAEWVAKIKTPTVLSDATDTYALGVGAPGAIRVFDTSAGALFRYRHDVNGGRWEARSRSSSASTEVDTTISVVADTWYILRIVWDGTQLTYFIDGTLRATITTNLPPNFNGNGVSIDKSVGTSSRELKIDFIGMTYNTTR